MNRGYSNQPSNAPGSSYDPNTVYFPPPYSVYNPTPQPVLPAARSIPTVLGLLNALKRRWVLATFLGLLAALAAAAGFWLAAPTGKHQVKAIVEILPLRSSLTESTNNASDAGFENFKMNQEVLIKTRTLLTKVVQDPRVAVLPMISGSEDPVKTVDDYIGTKWPGPSLMAILMNGDQPEQLQIIMEVLVKKYIEQAKLDLQVERETQKKSIEKAMAEQKQKYDRELEFISNMNKQGMNGSSPEANGMLLLRLDDKITDMDKEIQVASKKKDELESRIRINRSLLDNPDSIRAPESAMSLALDHDAAVLSAKQEMEQAELVLQSAIKSAPDPDNSPIVSKYKSALAAAKTKYEDTRKSRRPALEKAQALIQKADLELQLSRDENDLKILQANIESYKKQLNDYQEKRNKFNKFHNVFWSETDIQSTKDRLNKLKEQLFNIEILMGENRIVEKEKPIVIPNPNIKQKMMFGVAIAIVAFLLVMAIVAFLEWRSRRVDNVDQVLNELNLRVLGTIPAFPSRASLKAGEADMNQNWRFILNESVNSARTMLLHSAKTQSMQVLMVTSAMQGEGKTSLASQLATSMATAGMRTLILDLDLRNPSMNKLFDLPLTPGASEILLQEIDVSDAVQPTTVPNLWVIPAGQCSNRVIASLAQGHPIEMLFNRLRGQFDFIVIDTCPVLPVADALLIGQHVDGVVFSILQDISQLPKVLNASERLAQLNIPLLGAVVNGIKTDVHAYGYNYVKQLPA